MSRFEKPRELAKAAEGGWVLADWEVMSLGTIALRYRQERDAARAEVERISRERDEALAYVNEMRAQLSPSQIPHYTIGDADGEPMCVCGNSAGCDGA